MKRNIAIKKNRQHEAMLKQCKRDDRLLAQFEKLLDSPRLMELAFGPSRVAGYENTANVVAIENLRRAVASMRKLWNLGASQ